MVVLFSPVRHIQRWAVVDWQHARITLTQSVLEDYLPDGYGEDQGEDEDGESVLESQDAFDAEMVRSERLPLAWLVAFKKVKWPAIELEDMRLTPEFEDTMPLSRLHDRATEDVTRQGRHVMS
jgi:hypothetical protein